MKTLKGHTILYDENCPMCRTYTNAFVQSKMLEENGRQAYQQMPENFKCKIDTKRAVNEIALMNNQTGTVEYGVRSLFLIIQNRFPMLKSLFNSGLFFWFADKAYKFVSYNRRVIVPSGNYRKSAFLDGPALHIGYRSFYLVLAWLATAFILSAYSENLQPLVPGGSFYREFAVCGGQIFWQLVFIQILDREKTWDYLGHMMTISFAGSLILSGIGTIAALVGIEHPYFYAVSFMVVAGLMCLEHIRRTKLLRISWVMTVTWVMYRIALLFIIL